MSASYVEFSEPEVRVVADTSVPRLNLEALRKLANDTRRRMAEDKKSFPAARQEAMSNFPQWNLISQARFKQYSSALGTLFNRRKAFKKSNVEKPQSHFAIDARGQLLMRV